MCLDLRVLKLWAKSNPHHSLWCHLLDTAAVCLALMDRFAPVGPLTINWVSYVVALHDIGKADPHFQMKDETLVQPLKAVGLPFASVASEFRHEARSAEWLLSHLKTKWQWSREAAVVAASALHGHHGNFMSESKDSEWEHPERFECWEGIRNDLAHLVAEVLQVDEKFPPTDFNNASVVGVKLTGLIVLSDWIASNDELFSYSSIDRTFDPCLYWSACRSNAGKALARLQLDRPPVSAAPRATPSFADVWPACTNLRPSQQNLESICLDNFQPGLAIIEAPMGEGKTEAAIYLAECWNNALGRSGAYIGLPTVATSNQMHRRYLDFLSTRHPEVPSPYLVHGMAWLLDEQTPDSASQTYGDDTTEECMQSREWFRNAKRALLAPEAVGTVDQVLMAALNVKFGFLRLLGLSSKVLIVDEVHACDQYMNVILKRLLHWCGVLRVPVIMLSATLSAKQRQDLAKAFRPDMKARELETLPKDYPLLTFVPFTGQPKAFPVDVPASSRKSIRIIAHPGLLGDTVATAQMAISQVRNGGCACVLVNTVRHAQEVFERLNAERPDDVEAYLFHACYRAERRIEIEGDVVSRFGKDAGEGENQPRPRKAILVATQVVEQSLDLDFDVMISQIAPVDMLLQRCGRLHRHDRGGRPTGPDAVLHVLLPDAGAFGFGKAVEKVYPRELLLRTLALLHGRDRFHLPDDFRPLIEGCYGSVPLPDGVVPDNILGEAADERKTQLRDDERQAELHLIEGPNERVFRLAEMQRPVGEADDRKQADYFHAQTRLGDDTCPALVLSDPLLQSLAQSPDCPPKGLLKKLFLQKVNLPRWWIESTTPKDGYGLLTDGPKWLRGHAILVANNGLWCGEKKGEEVLIMDDPVIGLVMRKGVKDG